MFDLIGDVHGHANKLESLLTKLGYAKNKNGVYSHTERKVVFVGDYNDRPHVPESESRSRCIRDCPLRQLHSHSLPFALQSSMFL